MDFLTVISRLNDLPNTFKFNGPPYTQIVDGMADGASTFTLAADATLQQVQQFSNALDGWLDVWGLLWGVPRQQGEANSAFSLRISRTVLAWVGTLPALQAWVQFFATGGSVAENSNGLGYIITLPSSMSQTQIMIFLQSLNRIRPAGVPFSISQIGGGLFLGTVAFFGQGTQQGAFLSNGGSTVINTLNASTPNSVPLLPSLYFSDLYLGQPGLATAGPPSQPIVTGVQVGQE